MLNNYNNYDYEAEILIILITNIKLIDTITEIRQDIELKVTVKSKFIAIRFIIIISSSNY